jgi:hypothetical protein
MMGWAPWLASVRLVTSRQTFVRRRQPVDESGPSLRAWRPMPPREGAPRIDETAAAGLGQGGISTRPLPAVVPTPIAGRSLVTGTGTSGRQGLSQSHKMP